MSDRQGGRGGRRRVPGGQGQQQQQPQQQQRQQRQQQAPMDDGRDPRQGQRRHQRQAREPQPPVQEAPKQRNRNRNRQQQAPLPDPPQEESRRQKRKNKQQQQQQAPPPQDPPQQKGRRQNKQQAQQQVEPVQETRRQKKNKQQQGQQQQQQNTPPKQQQQQQTKKEKKQNKPKWAPKGAEEEAAAAKQDKPKKPRFNKIAALKPRRQNLFIIAMVDSVNAEGTFQPWKKTNNAPQTCTEVLVGDDSGCILMETREQAFVDVLQANVGKYVCLLNVEYNQGQGVARLGAGQFASIKPIDDCLDILPRKKLEKPAEGDAPKEGEKTAEGETPTAPPVREPITVDFQINKENDRSKLPDPAERDRANALKRVGEFEKKLAGAIAENTALTNKYNRLQEQFEAFKANIGAQESTEGEKAAPSEQPQQ